MCNSHVMAGHKQSEPAVSNLERFSFLFMLAALVLVIQLHLATPLLSVLFTYLALTRLQLHRRGGKWLAVGVLLAMLAGIAYGLGYFVNQTVRALPEIADKAIPSVIETA